MNARGAVAFSLLAVTAVAATTVPAAAPQRESGPRILVFSRTAGFRHSSIPAAIRAIRELGAQSGLRVDATEDPSVFRDGKLRRYRAVVFLMTTGDVLAPPQQAAFERFIRKGGGFAGVHSAADTEYSWPWYGGLIGAYFRSHPPIQRATIRVERKADPSTAGLPSTWARTDEWYNFARNPRGSVRVLAVLDESSYVPGDGAMGSDHPIAWAHQYRGGRAWYTAGGHTEAAYSEPLFRRHLLGGIRYAAGLTPPRIVSLRTGLRGRRVTVRLRYAACRPCRGDLRIGSSQHRLRLESGRASATTQPLSRGRKDVLVTLTDPLTGLRVVARRTLTVG
jgi:cytochrome c